jgi:tagaturonate epimerase
MILEKYSIGVGDRFGHQAAAQLQAIIKAREAGIDIVPVWNKSFREHGIIGTTPADVRKEADKAVKAKGWTGSYYVDADHINLSNVDGFIESSDFFTLDVADFTGKAADNSDIEAFVKKHERFAGTFAIEGIEQELTITKEQISEIAKKYLFAVKEAGRIYRHIEKPKGMGNFITEVSMDETDLPQTPVEMLFILAAVADENIPAQTIAPKFTGRFNKGVDYVGDVQQFEKEFNDDLAIIRFAIKEFGLPGNLKLSIHSGSDKFSIYGPINRAIKKFDTGLHLKTAGTTWLEELIGLAEAQEQGLEIAKEIYCEALKKYDELCAPYATVIDIDRNNLPDEKVVRDWNGHMFTRALRHEQSCKDYNPNFRQLLHVGYKIAANMGTRFSDALKIYENIIASNVTENIYERHIAKIFLCE